MVNGKGIRRVILFSEELVKDSVRKSDGTVKVKSVDVFQLLWQPLGVRSYLCASLVLLTFQSLQNDLYISSGAQRLAGGVGAPMRNFVNFPNQFER